MPKATITCDAGDSSLAVSYKIDEGFTPSHSLTLALDITSQLAKAHDVSFWAFLAEMCALREQQMALPSDKEDADE